MFHVYVLKSQKTGRRYVGSCEDLDDRFRRHNNAESKATKHGIPWTLVHSESFPTRAEAAARERYFKTGRGRDELNRLGVERSPRRQVAGSNPVTPTIFSLFNVKLILCMTCAAIFGGMLVAHGQEATDVDLAKQAEQTPQPSATPAGPAAVPELKELDEAFKQTSMGKAGDAQRLRLEWRRLRNQVANDPDLIATKRAADAARTDLEKRERLRAYYKLYYARLRRLSLSPAMKGHIDEMEAMQLGLIAQPRVRPSAQPAATISE